MLRKILCAALALLTVAVIQVRGVSPEERLPGDILVTQRDGDQVVSTGRVELCRAGELMGEGYLLAEEFGGGYISQEDVNSPEFALWMARKAGLGIIEPVDAYGSVRYTAMEPGLYLVRQREPAEGYYSFRPYTVSVTGEMTLIDTYPVMQRDESNPTTSEPLEPYLAALGIALTLTGFLFWDSARRKDAPLEDN